MLFKKKNDDQFVFIGKEKIEVRKLSVRDWRKVFGTLNSLPGVLVSAIFSDRKKLTSLIIAAVDVCFDEVVEILSITSGLDKAYIEENAALDEVVEYIEKLVKKNNLAETIKKLMTAGDLFLPQAPEKANHQNEA